jgi:hypothetical protein
MKLTKTLLNSFYKTTSSQIVHIPKAIKKPKEGYLEPSEWNFSFDKPSQVKPRAFADVPHTQCISKIGGYQNPEYFAYHTYSYYDMERDLFCKRCRPQPSPFRSCIDEIADEKSPS